MQKSCATLSDAQTAAAAVAATSSMHLLLVQARVDSIAQLVAAAAVAAAAASYLSFVAWHLALQACVAAAL
jgi:hypothetical protein